MAEYIDKEKLLQKLSRMIDYCKKDNKVNGLTALFQVGDAIMDCPAIEIIECKDCGSYNKHYGECTLNGSHFGENGYCCRGTRTPKERGGEK